MIQESDTGCSDSELGTAGCGVGREALSRAGWGMQLSPIL